MHGGFDTQVFAFILAAGAPEPFAGPLILRLFGPHQTAARALREQAVQNALAAMGYPAPRAFTACTDLEVLGGAFLVMERMPGRPMLEVRKRDLAGVLVRMQLRLHDLDSQALQASVKKGTSRDMPSFGDVLSDLGGRVRNSSIDGLARAMRWLEEHRPPEPRRAVICHGDFHPQNILMHGGVVSAVLDWPNAVIGDPAFDVAATRVILAYAPLELAALPGPLQWLVRAARPILVARYVAGYRCRRPLDGTALAYYEAAGCVRALVRVAEARLSAATRPEALNPLDASSFGERVADRFAELTGISPSLPPPV